MSAHPIQPLPNTEIPNAEITAQYRKVLWAALIINVIMFFVEIGVGIQSGSTALLADALDFAGDAANYSISLLAITHGIIWQTRAALVKGFTMISFGSAVIVKAIWAAWIGIAPEAITMGAVALLALIANLSVALLLYTHRNGNANMRSVWLCSRNDVIGNMAVIIAAIGVVGSGSVWPDLTVAFIMAGLAITSGWSVIRQSHRELQTLN